jgi:hypothetical protein
MERSDLFNADNLRSTARERDRDREKQRERSRRERERSRWRYLDTRVLHGIRLFCAVVVGGVVASGSIMRPGLVSVDEILVGDLVESDSIHGLEEDTRELVAGEIVQPAEHNLVIEVLRADRQREGERGRERERQRERGQQRQTDRGRGRGLTLSPNPLMKMCIPVPSALVPILIW